MSGAQSSRLVEYSVTFKVKVGSLKTLAVTITDEDGTAKNLTNTTDYATVKFKVWKPDGTLIIDGDGTYSDRANGVVAYTLATADTVVANAGNWTGEVQTLNTSSEISDQSDNFGFDILLSY